MKLAVIFIANLIFFCTMAGTTPCLAQTATAAQEDDFEIVEVGKENSAATPARGEGNQKSNKTGAAEVVAPNTALNSQPAISSGTQGEKLDRTGKRKISDSSKPQRGKNLSSVQNAQLSETGNLPLRVEVSDRQPNSLVTLAVGAATRFHCEEKVTRLVIGNLTDIGVTKAGSKNWYGFYLRPVTGGITTNMFIEFSSGATVMINVKTVEPKKGLKPGDYNSEVFVKTAAVRDELARLNRENLEFRDSNNKLRASVEALTAEKEKARQQAEKTKLTDDEIFRVLEQSSLHLKNNSSLLRGAVLEKLKINPVSPLYEVRAGIGYLFIELDNKGKSEAVITKIELIDAKGSVTASVPNLTVKPLQALRFGLKTEIEQSEGSQTRLRFTEASGKSAEILLSGFTAGRSGGGTSGE